MMTVERPIRTRADLQGRRALVLGLARSGVAAARYLADAGAVVTVYDRRPRAELGDAVAGLAGRDVRLALGASTDEAVALVRDAGLLVTSPSISPRFPTTDAWLRDVLAGAESRGVELVSEVELFLRLTVARVMAVTGTKGKTTTTALLGAMLEAGGVAHEVGGNIGRPLIEVADVLPRAAWAVLELSELQLPTITRGADVAVYTNILADHLDRHGTVEAYRAVKARLAELTVARGGDVVLNADDPVSVALGGRLAGGRLHWYGAGAANAAPPLEASESEGDLRLGEVALLPVADVSIPGAHLRSDVLAAALGARLAGVEPAAIATAIRGFAGVPHRLETLGWRAGVRWVNDSQATIPPAAIAALDAFVPAPVVLIAGGKDKGLDYGAFAERIVARCREVVLIGETAGTLAGLIGGRIGVRQAASMDQAVAMAADLAHEGDVVLLSPAAASFDMFTDYAARGDAFRAAASAIGVIPAGAQEPAS
jgi:UDP-N-acetylmuramoylalanine--D-glutamate ligase